MELSPKLFDMVNYIIFLVFSAMVFCLNVALLDRYLPY